MAKAEEAQTDESKETIADFKEAVNMTAAQLEKWLDTEESKEVGYKESEGGESVGHQSGKHIIKLLAKNKSDYDEDDLKFMKKVVGYVNRHSAQKPDGDITDTRWRYSLMNWGHDPKKK